MAGGDIPEEVRDLLTRCISSVEALEVLLLLQRTAERWWTPDAVAAELRTSRASAARRLEEFGKAGFLDVRLGEDVNYRYAPSSEGTARAVSLLADTYRERRVSVINLIFSKPLDHVRDFADAFRLRKEDDGDR